MDELKAISRDYSVQAHFGKIWMRNILLNLSSFSANPEIHCDTHRTAAVIAAGPSLDQTAGMLAAKRDSYYIISTDTAYGSLLRRGLTPDAVVSVDGQHISTTHFFPCPERADDAAARFSFLISAPMRKQLPLSGSEVIRFTLYTADTRFPALQQSRPHFPTWKPVPGPSP